MQFGSLFSTPRAKPRRKPARRGFDTLEKRYVLSSAPVVDFLYAMVGNDHDVSISGHVSDYDPDAGQISIALSGPVQANAIADSEGNFTVSGTAAQLGTEQAVATDAGTGLSSNPFQTPLEDMPPQITGLSVMAAGDGTNVMISGSVSDESLGNLSVNFSGVVSGSTTTDSSGNFSFYGLASGLGSVTATSTDVWGVASEPVSTGIYVSPPMVQLNDAMAAPDGTVTITGYVYDMSPASDSVTISGVVSGTATPDSSGYFSLTGHASGSGTVTATATNVWGLASDSPPANVTIYDPPPQIMDLGVTALGPGEWEISGYVTDDNLAGLVVNFSGSVSGPVPLNPDGSFSFVISLDPEDYYYGYINVTAVDSSAQVAEDTVYLG